MPLSCGARQTRTTAAPSRCRSCAICCAPPASSTVRPTWLAAQAWEPELPVVLDRRCRAHARLLRACLQLPLGTCCAPAALHAPRSTCPAGHMAEHSRFLDGRFGGGSRWGGMVKSTVQSAKREDKGGQASPSSVVGDLDEVRCREVALAPERNGTRRRSLLGSPAPHRLQCTGSVSMQLLTSAWLTQSTLARRPPRWTRQHLRACWARSTGACGPCQPQRRCCRPPRWACVAAACTWQSCMELSKLAWHLAAARATALARVPARW